MNEGYFQSASSCVKYPYIGELHLQKIDIAFIFYEILRLSFWLKSSLMLHFWLSIDSVVFAWTNT